jgi:hypothetical protein
MANGGRTFLCMTTNGAPYGRIGEDGGIWLASVLHRDLGYFDLQQKTLQPLDNAWLTFAISPAAPTPPTPSRPMLTK